LWQLINKADIIIAHFANGFDVPLMNARFIINGMTPPSFYKVIDTKAVASRHFKFPSNKLDAIAGYFGLGSKIKTNFMLWRKCMEGDENALEEMRIYNIQDVELLEDVYLKLRPFIKSHPNLNLYMETNKHVCANCGNHNIKFDSYYYTSVNKYEVYRCSCGALSRLRTPIKHVKPSCVSISQ
jgi:DNA polymerase III epsilon subunit-like protein